MGLFDFVDNIGPSAEAMQKAVLLAGNVQGVSGVDIAGLKVPQPTPVAVLFEANREVIKQPDLIFPGQKIRIPAPM